MSLIQWIDDYNTGVAEIDYQHRKLVQIINELSNAMRRGEGQDVLGSVLNQMVNYTLSHFSSEERVMQRCQFPDLEKHRLQHDEFREKVTGLLLDMKTGKKVITTSLLSFLRQWLNNHILDSDKQIGVFLKTVVK